MKKKLENGLKVLTEDAHQKLLFSWAKHHRICSQYMFAIPNGGTRNIREAVNLKKQGVRPGVSDVFLAFPTKLFGGLWVELKRDRTCKLQACQKKWIEDMGMVGYRAEVAYGFDEAKAIILEYLNDL